MLGAQIHVQQHHENRAHHPHQQDRPGQEFGIGGEQEAHLIDIDRLVGLAHDIQVYGIQGYLGENTRQDVGNAQLGVQEAGDQARGNTGQEGNEQRQLGIPPGKHQHNAHGAAGGKASVHGQVGKAQHPVGHVDTQGHDTPDQSLGNAAGTGPQQRRRIQRSKVGKHEIDPPIICLPRFRVFIGKNPGKGLALPGSIFSLIIL